MSLGKWTRFVSTHHFPSRFECPIQPGQVCRVLSYVSALEKACAFNWDKKNLETILLWQLLSRNGLAEDAANQHACTKFDWETLAQRTIFRSETEKVILPLPIAASGLDPQIFIFLFYAHRDENPKRLCKSFWCLTLQLLEYKLCHCL